ncbi:MAG: SDR family NAD(P)-dependent oxidoreductase [Candidatus Pacebacteria bacterium]|nr:SDR family NAD(P)-dependent oxidoreductase [Candidatus Paceibacterota bacterium]
MKTILISGGSEGLGRAMAEKFAKKYKVIILCRDEKKTSEVAKEIGCDHVIGDVSDYKTLEKAVAGVIGKYKTIDYLINNAGILVEGSIENNTPEDIQRVMNVNTVGTMFLTKAVLPFMKKEKKGRIINVISQAGLTATSERVVYNTSKWAITGFTKSLTMDCKPFGISVVGFFPGLIKTAFWKKQNSKRDLTSGMEPEEVARAMEFILETPEHLAIPELGIKPAWS